MRKWKGKDRKKQWERRGEMKQVGRRKEKGKDTKKKWEGIGEKE